MSGLLILDLTAPDGASWALRRDGAPGSGEAATVDRGTAAGPEDIAGLPVETLDRAVIVVPGEDVLVRIVELPAKSEAQARAALPFLMEDDLAVAPEGLHFALGAATDGPRRLAAAVAPARMNEWHAWAGALKGVPVRCVPDTLSLDPGEGLLLDDRGDRVVVTGGQAGRPLAGFAAEADLVPLLLPALLPEAERVRVASDRPQTLAPAAGWGARAVETGPPLDAKTRETMRFDVLGRKPAIDLFQGAYAVRRRFSADVGPWKRAAALAASLVVIWFGLQVSQAVRLDRLTDATYAEAEAVLTRTFPEVTRVVNPRAQMAARVDQLRAGGSDGYLRLSGILFDAMRDLPQVEVESLRFDGEARELSVAMTFAAYPDMERMRRAIEDRGARVDEGGSRQSGDRIQGDITVRLGS